MQINKKYFLLLKAYFECLCHWHNVEDKQGWGVFPRMTSRECCPACVPRVGGAEPKVKIFLDIFRDWWWEWRGRSPWAGQTKQEKEGQAGPRNRIVLIILYGLCLMTWNDCALLSRPGQYESIIQHSKDDDDHHHHDHLHLYLSIFTKMKQNNLFSHVSDMG